MINSSLINHSHDQYQLPPRTPRRTHCTKALVVLVELTEVLVALVVLLSVVLLTVRPGRCHG